MKKIIFIFFIIISISSCNQNKEYKYIINSGGIFHTTYHIKYKYYKDIQAEIDSELSKFDLSLNPFNKQSIIYKINNNQSVLLDSFCINVFNKAKEVSQISNGLFDITVAPIVNAWGFGFKNIDKITPQIIDSLLNFVGYKKINIKDNKLIKSDSRTMLDASAIAKGYSCDVVASLLKKKGITDYMIEIGGEINASGVNDKGGYWQIGIENPVYDSTGIDRDINNIAILKNKSMATSGNYRNFYVKNNKIYAHTINPKTGYPVQNEILSATVIANDCMTADAFATVFMVAGVKESERIMKDIPNIHYYFICSTDSSKNYTTVYSKGFKEFLKK